MTRRAIFDYLPKGGMTVLREVVRLLFRRPVVGVAAVARRGDGQLLLVRRNDTGTWSLPGGTLEWGECARVTLARELAEEAGATVIRTGRLVGVYTDPRRDPRMHGVTIVVEAHVEDGLRGPENPLEIQEARFFEPALVPRPLAFTFDDALDHALRGEGAFWE